MTTTKAHKLYNYLRDKYGNDAPKKGGTMKKSMDNDSFALRFYNLSDKEFDYAITDHYDDDNDIGLHAEWD